MLDCVPNVSKLAIFEDEEVVILSQSLQFLAEGWSVILSQTEEKSLYQFYLS